MSDVIAGEQWTAEGGIVRKVRVAAAAADSENAFPVIVLKVEGR